MAAAMPKGGDDGAVISEINVTPLVDVTLILLIIMMVAAPILANTPSIKVALPRAATGDDTQKSPLALTLSAQPAGGYSLFANGEPITDAALRARLPALVRENPDLQVIIAADQRIAYGDVVHIVDLVQALGVHKFALNTDRIR